VLSFLRQNRWLVLSALLCGAALRLMFILKFAGFDGDPRVYADIASNWLHHGIFGVTDQGVPVPTYIRLPGYPAFLAACFVLFHSGDLHNILFVQMFIDLLTCLLIAGFALEWFGDRTAKAALWFSALLPFTANYVALPLTETLSIFFTALSLFAGARVLRALDSGVFDRRQCAIAGVACACNILLRPDGGMVLIAFALMFGFRWLRSPRRAHIFSAGMLVALIALAPLAPWTARNWRTFHRFQPLAPRYANAPGEYVPMGFIHWCKTWLVDYSSVENVYWQVTTDTASEKADFTAVPARAFDSAEQRQTVKQIFDDYNARSQLSPELDARFAAVAVERIRQHPIEYFAVFPALRVLDMWFRPRTEMLPVDHVWWPSDPWELSVAVGFVTINAILVLLAVAGAWRAQKSSGLKLLFVYVLLRSAFLSTMENPEPRYMLECYPVVVLLAALAISELWARMRLVRHPELRTEVL